MKTTDALELAIGVLADLEGEQLHTSRRERTEAIARLRQLQQTKPATGSEDFPFFAVAHTFEDGDHDVVLVGSFPAEVDELDPDSDGDYRALTVHNREELVRWADREYGSDGEWELLELADMGELWKRRQRGG